jgi:MFS family permease
LYVLYEGYGFSPASLYSLGFVSGAFSSPFIGALVDKFGRKKAAVLYCILEIIINYMEQHPILIGLVLSRVIGGLTTNLLCSCFATWLVTEHRKRGFKEESLEIILRDSGIVSNSAAVISGLLAHYLAASLGPVGPFQGAVVTTFFALLLVSSLWTENYGDSGVQSRSIYSHMGTLLFMTFVNL